MTIRYIEDTVKDVFHHPRDYINVANGLIVWTIGSIAFEIFKELRYQFNNLRKWDKPEVTQVFAKPYGPGVLKEWYTILRKGEDRGTFRNIYTIVAPEGYRGQIRLDAIGPHIRVFKENELRFSKEDRVYAQCICYMLDYKIEDATYGASDCEYGHDWVYLGAPCKIPSISWPYIFIAIFLGYNSFGRDSYRGLFTRNYTEKQWEEWFGPNMPYKTHEELKETPSEFFHKVKELLKSLEQQEQSV